MDWRLFWSKCRLWLGERVVNYFLYGLYGRRNNSCRSGRVRDRRVGAIVGMFLLLLSQKL